MTDLVLRPCPRCEGEVVPHGAYENASALRRWAACSSCQLQSPQMVCTFAALCAWWNERKAEPMTGSVQPAREPETHSAGRAPEPEPTRAAKDEPPHVCPYGGRAGRRPEDHFEEPSHRHVLESWWDCGDHGWLCDRCQQDRADARTRAVVRAITAVLMCVSEDESAAKADAILRQEGLL